MVEYILGSYLVDIGRLSDSQFHDVLDKFDKIHVKLGFIAVAEGMMTVEQADEVNRLQAVMDKRFGDIAVEKGYLTDDQINSLLKVQGNTYLTFVQALVNDGIITMDEVETLTEGYCAKYGFSRTDMDVLKSDNPELIVPLFLTADTLKYHELIGVAVRTLLRCVDRHVYIGRATLTENVTLTDGALQIVEGEKGFTSAFAESKGGLLRMASIFGQEDFPELNEDALDAAGEFLNCVNGLYASSLSQKGEKLELAPPEYISGSRELPGQVCSIPLYVNDKEFLFMVTQ